MSTKERFRYFAQELQFWYKRYFAFGLLYSVAFHIVLVGIFYLIQKLNDEPAVVFLKKTPPIIVTTPPSISGNPQQQPQPFSSVSASVKVAIPIPVPDEEVSPDQTIADQSDMYKIKSDTPFNENDSVIFDGKFELPSKPLTEKDPEPDEFIPVEKYPEVIKIVQPIYPALAIRGGLECTVLIKILINKEGYVEKAVVIQDEGLSIFDDPAITAVKQWVFTPAIMNNHPIKLWIMVPLRFRLR